MTENTHVVAKPFNTASQRFTVGMELSAADIPRDNPISFDDLKARKFIVGKDTKAAEKAQDRIEESAPPVVEDPVEAPIEVPVDTDESARGRKQR